MKVLIIKISSMGDILHTLPALTDAMIYYPNIQFDWIIEENFSQIPSWHSSVNRIIPITIRQWKKNFLSKLAWSQRKFFCDQLQHYKYDAVIDAQGLLKSVILITRLSNGVKHGYNWKSIREPLASLFYDHRYNINKQLHAVERIRNLFANSLQYKKPIITGDYGIMKYFSSLELVNEITPYIIFFYATTANKKHWPESHWRKLIMALRDSGLTIKLPWITDIENKQAIRLASGFNHVKVLPKLSLNEIAQQIISAKAVVSVDTGLSHLTAAFAKPNITLYGPTDPKLIGCYGKEQKAIISPNGNMAIIKPDEIYQHLILKLDNKQ
ncbi:MAG: lipopolysaccharide heptosyltransferase RfaC [Arsenophonus sp.]